MNLSYKEEFSLCLHTQSGDKSCCWLCQYHLSHRNCGITHGWWLMRTGYHTCCHTYDKNWYDNQSKRRKTEFKPVVDLERDGAPSGYFCLRHQVAPQQPNQIMGSFDYQTMWLFLLFQYKGVCKSCVTNVQSGYCSSLEESLFPFL